LYCSAHCTIHHFLSFCVFVIVSTFHDTATPHSYTLSLHDALPISIFQQVIHTDIQIPVTAKIEKVVRFRIGLYRIVSKRIRKSRSEEHTSELQSRFDLVCRLLLEKKKTNKRSKHRDT